MGEGEPNFREEVEAESSEIGEITPDEKRATLLGRYLSEKFKVSAKNHRENSRDGSSFELETYASSAEIDDELTAFFESSGFKVTSAKETPGMLTVKNDEGLVLSVTVARGDETGRTIIAVRELFDSRRDEDNPGPGYYSGFTVKDLQNK